MNKGTYVEGFELNPENGNCKFKRYGDCALTRKTCYKYGGNKEDCPIVDADIVSVVRCKDCKFAHMTYGGECKYCDAWESEESLYLDGDFFCAFGERKDDDTD